MKEPPPRIYALFSSHNICCAVGSLGLQIVVPPLYCRHEWWMPVSSHDPITAEGTALSVCQSHWCPLTCFRGHPPSDGPGCLWPSGRCKTAQLPLRFLYSSFKYTPTTHTSLYHSTPRGKKRDTEQLKEADRIIAYNKPLKLLLLELPLWLNYLLNLSLFIFLSTFLCA